MAISTDCFHHYYIFIIGITRREGSLFKLSSNYPLIFTNSNLEASLIKVIKIL
jgi:hypothetical protein